MPAIGTASMTFGRTRITDPHLLTNVSFGQLAATHALQEAEKPILGDTPFIPGDQEDGELDKLN